MGAGTCLGGKESEKAQVCYGGVSLGGWWMQLLIHVLTVDTITQGEHSKKKKRGLSRVAGRPVKTHVDSLSN